MRIIEQNKWLIINDLIYDIHSIEPLDEMREKVLNNLKLLIDYDLATFWLADFYGDKLLTNPIGINTTKESLCKYNDQDFESEDETAWIMRSGKSMVYRETDLINVNDRKRTEYYKEIYEKQNIYYSLQIAIAYAGNFLGIISLCKCKDNIDFSEKDLFICEILKEHLNYRFWRDSPAYKQNLNVIDHYKFTLIANENQLTKRETEVCELLMQDLYHNEISEKLYISNNTLKKHITSIYKKCSVSNKFQLRKLFYEEKK